MGGQVGVGRVVRSGMVVVALALAWGAPGEASAQAIPRLERAAGPCTSCAADGWTIVATSPDVIVGNGPWPGGTYTMSDILGGPFEGSNMQLLLSGTPSTLESVGATITGLVAGQTYTLSIRYQGARLASGSIVYEYGDFQVITGGGTYTYPTSAGDAWAEAAITFTASATTQSVTIRCGSFGTGTYGGAVVADGATIRVGGAAPDGSGCTDASACASGHCVDGVCCATACAGQCEACDLSGSVGTCAAVTGAPRGARAACAGDGSVCDGTCDGVRRDACTYPGAAVTCRGASCVAGTATAAASCDGAGACPPGSTTPCTPYVCGVDACLTGCSTDGECAPGHYCEGGACTPLVPDGGLCDRDGACVSTHCVDGLCCDTACIGQCEACDVAGSEGTCAAVTGAPHGGRTACSTDGSLCGGACDGALRLACAYPGESTICRAGACAGGVAIVEASCNGAGACPIEMTMTCAPFLCGEAACAGECASDEDCDASAFCAGGLCVIELPDGDSCDRARQCGSDQCVDGVCCASACEGQCEACDVAGSEGTCAAVTGTPHGARAACGSDGSECAGACDGTARGACVYPDRSESCGEPTCADGVAAEGGTCDGTGSCDGGETTECAPYVCGESSCLDSCTGVEDCVSGHMCTDGECVVLALDAGAMVDAGTGPDGGAPVSVAGGCGCSVPSRAAHAPMAAWLALLVLGGLVRRRGRRRG